jgi:hypothetical protein
VAPEEGHRQLMATLPSLSPVVNGWQMNTSAVGSYGTDYLRRAIVAMTNFGAMLPEDSVSLVNVIASDGAPPSGKHRYLVHFEKDALPPVRAFWSLNMYDGEGFPARNPSSRFAIGDRDSLNYNHDGSLDIHVQKERPSADKVSNWLPSPEAAMALVLRLYSPRAEALDGRWLPPTIQRLSDGPEEG